MIAALILAQFVIGSIAEDMKLTPAKLDLFVWHKSIGVTVLLLAVLRLAWRLANPPPALPAATPSWERKFAAAAHWAGSDLPEGAAVFSRKPRIFYLLSGRPSLTG